MWEESQIIHFQFQGRKAMVVQPAGHAKGRLVLKAEYVDAFPAVEEELVAQGYHLCYVEHQSRWAPRAEVEVTASFLRSVTDTYNLCKRVAVVGMSCGGLLAAKLAAAYPELVSVLYLDAPVLNVLSMVGLGEAAFDEQFYRELVSTYGFSKSTVINFRESAIDQMENLISHQIPVVLVYGNADNVVIYEENGKVLEEYYKKHNGEIKVISKSMCGHHPHGLDDPKPILDFIESRWRQ